MPTFYLSDPPHPGMTIFRGILAIAFGALALAWPQATILTLALFFGAYALVDGVTALFTGIRRGRERRSWGAFVVEGVLGIAVGLMTLLLPGMTALMFSYLVGAWALLTGFAEIYASTQIRKIFGASRGEAILMGIAGALSVALGLAIFVFPVLGAITLVTLVATYALIFGSLLVAFGFRMRRLEKIGAKAVEMGEERRQEKPGQDQVA